VSDTEKPPPKDPDEYSAFRELLDKIAKVPKEEVDEQQRRFEDRPALRKKAR
jgi:hypothetical protein